MDKKKVLFFLPPCVGGAERITITIAKMLPQDEFECKFVIVGNEKGDIVNFIPQGYTLDLVKVHNIWDFTTYRIHSLIKREKPYAVFCSLMYLNSRVALAGQIAGVKVILRNCNYMSVTRWDQKIMCKLTYPYADVIISQQEEMADDIVKEIGVPVENVVTLHNPIDTETINAKLQGVTNPYPQVKQTNFVWVGRVNHQKGQDIAIRAFAMMYNKVENAHLYLVGKYDKNSEYVKSLFELIKEYKIQDQVHFIGFDSNPYRWVKFADCFVLPSRIEGLPNTLIEAQYLGCSAAASKCIPIIERILSDGVNGCLAEKENPESLAKAMEKAVKLGRVEMTYKSATKEDFIKLFDEN